MIVIVGAAIQNPAIRSDFVSMVRVSIPSIDSTAWNGGEAGVERIIDLKKAIKNLKENKFTRIPGMVKQVKVTGRGQK